MLLELYDNFYPRSPCGERPDGKLTEYSTTDISIHALLAESDSSSAFCSHCVTSISIHALLAESDASCACWRQQSKHFYPRSPCGERPTATAGKGGWTSISIHALLAESDVLDAVVFPHRAISIHALLAESDVRAARLCSFHAISIHALLAESDSRNSQNINREHNISIHALLAESDETLVILPKQLDNFYPRSPCGERQLDRTSPLTNWTISIHALLAESDRHKEI